MVEGRPGWCADGGDGRHQYGTGEAGGGGALAPMLNRCGRHGRVMVFAFDDLTAVECWRRELRTAPGGERRGSYGVGLPRRRAIACGRSDAKNTT
jgi:hypothetical protein